MARPCASVEPQVSDGSVRRARSAKAALAGSLEAPGTMEPPGASGRRVHRGRRATNRFTTVSPSTSVVNTVVPVSATIPPPPGSSWSSPADVIAVADRGRPRRPHVAHVDRRDERLGVTDGCAGGVDAPVVVDHHRWHGAETRRRVDEAALRGDLEQEARDRGGAGRLALGGDAAGVVDGAGSTPVGVEPPQARDEESRRWRGRTRLAIRDGTRTGGSWQARRRRDGHQTPRVSAPVSLSGRDRRIEAIGCPSATRSSPCSSGRGSRTARATCPTGDPRRRVRGR